MVHDEELHCDWALFSRAGWTLFDDTTSPMIDPEDPDGWWEIDAPNKNKNDLYLFTHGLDYLGALADYRMVGGVIPMLPKQTWGTWWTRWFNYNTDGIQKVVNDFKQYVALPSSLLRTSRRDQSFPDRKGFTHALATFHPAVGRATPEA